MFWISPHLEFPADNKGKSDIKIRERILCVYINAFCGEFDKDYDNRRLGTKNDSVNCLLQKTCPFMLALSCILSAYYQGLL